MTLGNTLLFAGWLVVFIIVSSFFKSSVSTQTWAMGSTSSTCNHDYAADYILDRFINFICQHIFGIPGLKRLHRYCVYKKAKHTLNVCFRVLVWAIRILSPKICILFPNHYKFVFPGAIFVLKKTIIYDLKKPGFQFVVRNCFIKCGEIICFDAAEVRKIMGHIFFLFYFFRVLKNPHLIDTTFGICCRTVSQTTCT
jgi:hypothetical protein